MLGAWQGLQGHALPSAALAPGQAPHGCWALAFRGPVENRLTQFDSPVCQLHPYKVPVLLYLCMPRSNRFGDLMWDVVPRGDSPQGPRRGCQCVGTDGVNITSLGAIESPMLLPGLKPLPGTHGVSDRGSSPRQGREECPGSTDATGQGVRLSIT